MTNPEPTEEAPQEEYSDAAASIVYFCSCLQVFSAFIFFFVGIYLFMEGAILITVGIFVLTIPTTLGLAIVFSYVGSQMERKNTIARKARRDSQPESELEENSSEESENENKAEDNEEKKDFWSSL